VGLTALPELVQKRK